MTGTPADASMRPGDGAATGARRRNIEAIFPLRPAQLALTLYASDTGRREVDPGFLQIRFSLHGELSPEPLRAAWKAVVRRHAALRMSVHSVPDQRPMMIVWKQLEAPWAYLDWSEAPIGETERRVASLLETDRLNGLDVSAPPVMRFTVVRCSDRRHEVVWTCHHLFLDGWSSAVVIKDLLASYGDLRQGREPEPAPVGCSYRDYMGWLREQDERETEAFWRRRLGGVVPPPPLRLDQGPPPAGTGVPKFGDVSSTIPKERSQRLRAACLATQITPNALIQGAWALLLSQLYGSQDLVFGATVAGRPPDLTGIESLAGFFSNSIPIRVKIDPDQGVVPWLRGIRDDQLESQAHAHADLADIQFWVEGSGNRALFETLVVVENFPWKGFERAGDLVLSDYRSATTSTYPLTLTLIPSGCWFVQCRYQIGRFSEPAVADLLSVYVELLERLTADAGARVLTVADWLGNQVARTRLGDRQHRGNAEVSAGSSPAKREGPYLPPRSQDELTIARIWEETLGIHPVGVTDDFFALGGTSLTAVRLFSAIEERLGKRLPLATLLERPTVERLAEAVESESRAAWTSLVPIQTQGTRTPLFCIHAGGGHVLFYRDLAARLGPDQPVFGLEPIGLDGEQPPLATIAQMASHYVDELQSVQPNGPYRLLGYCIGGTVGLEMARELERRGQRAALLVVVDSGLWWGPGPPKTFSERARRLARRALGVARKDGAPDLLRLMTSELRIAATKTYRRLSRPWILRFGNPASRGAVWLQLVEKTCNHAFRTYRPGPCGAPVTLVRTSEYVGLEEKDDHLKWRAVTPRLDVHVVAGKHETILLEPGVAQVARIVRDALDATQDGGGAESAGVAGQTRQADANARPAEPSA